MYILGRGHYNKKKILYRFSRLPSHALFILNNKFKRKKKSKHIGIGNPGILMVLVSLFQDIQQVILHVIIEILSYRYIHRLPMIRPVLAIQSLL